MTPKTFSNGQVEYEFTNRPELNMEDILNVNPSSFYRKIPLTKEQTKKRKASKQARKSRKTNRRK